MPEQVADLVTGACGVLAGIRVLDCTFGLAGPEATRLLAEAGADVVKVEPPRGDPTRGTAAFATWNRSKRGVVLILMTKATGDGSTNCWPVPMCWCTVSDRRGRTNWAWMTPPWRSDIRT